VSTSQCPNDLLCRKLIVAGIPESEHTAELLAAKCQRILTHSHLRACRSYVLTLDDPKRFRRSRDVGGFLGLRPKQRDSGQSQPQLRITKEGDPYLRKLLVQGAHYILGWRGPDTDLRRWGLKLAARGGKNAKKRAVVAVARKLAVLLHRIWVSGENYEPLRHSLPVPSPSVAA